MTPSMDTGTAALASWLAEHKHSQAWLARQLGVSPGVVTHWMRGRQRPSLDVAAALERVTDGAVLAVWWARDYRDKSTG